MKLFEYYNRIENDIKGFAKSLSSNDWEDLIQQAWLKAVNSQYIFEEMTYYQMRSWFYKVIRSGFIDTIRKNHGMVYLEDGGSEFEDDCNTDGWMSEYAAKQMLNPIDGEDRTIFVLRHIIGYNSKEIGNLIGMNPSTVRYRLKKSAETIKSKIKRSDYYE